jgi:hypothetical protein
MNALLKTVPESLSILPETVRTHMSRIGSTVNTLRWINQALTCDLNQVRLSVHL